MQALVAQLGGGFVYVGRGLDGRLVCAACGARDIACEVHNLDSSRSLFA